MMIPTQAKMQIDAALRTIHEIARERGLGSIDITVRVDGRVDFRGLDANGYTKSMARGDLVANPCGPSGQLELLAMAPNRKEES